TSVTNLHQPSWPFSSSRVKREDRNVYCKATYFSKKQDILRRQKVSKKRCKASEQGNEQHLLCLFADRKLYFLRSARYPKKVNRSSCLIQDNGRENILFSTARNLLPHLFYQLYTLHGIQVNSSIPLLYALLPDKIEATYVWLLQQVKQVQPEAFSEAVVAEFEPAIVSAIRQEFPRARHRECFLHFLQCIFQGFRQKIFREKAQHLIDYFEDCWTGRPQRCMGRRMPCFSLEMWNCYEGVRHCLPKTNNQVDSKYNYLHKVPIFLESRMVNYRTT
ncbi:unnamed protein product, partial [Soboliphyme baturini]|uniref:MULE domain-containing protein n=1 Tax=Soboliphyme baturini TaxID=241478 RepID=A0A183I9H3_9BILA